MKTSGIYCVRVDLGKRGVRDRVFDNWSLQACSDYYNRVARKHVRRVSMWEL